MGETRAATNSDSSLTPQVFRRRIHLTIGGIIAFWVVLAIRLLQLQWIGSDSLAAKAVQQQSAFETVQARPGEIFDRNGRLLATSVATRSLYIDPSAVSDISLVVNTLSTILNLDVDRLYARIEANREKKFLWIQRRLTNEQAEQVRQLKLPDDWWGFRNEYLRRYPQGSLAAHLIGIRDIDGQGHGGVEQGLGKRLAGTSGKRELIRDARGRVIDVVDIEATATTENEQESESPFCDGDSVALTIDSVIQLFAERELDRVMQVWNPRHCCTIVMDPRTNEILAMASRPTFDPNRPAEVSDDAWINTTIGAMYEPGSTVKPLVVAWGLQQGILRRDERIFCENGRYRMGRRILRDHHPYGWLSLTDVIAKSSNIGMAKIGERLENRGLNQAIANFGLGKKTGVGLPGEISGLVRPLPQWDLFSTGSVPMGQEIAITPLQLIAAYAALLHEGQPQRPKIVKQFVEPDGAKAGADMLLTSNPLDGTSAEKKWPPRINDEICRWLIESPMSDVVKRGTGKRAHLPGYAVFGKTGTAQKIDSQLGRYSSERLVCSFICGAPAENPQLLVLLVVDEPSLGRNHGGGSVAAPAAAEILSRSLEHLRISPTQPGPLAEGETSQSRN